MFYRGLGIVLATVVLTTLSLPTLAQTKELRIAYQPYTAYAPALVAKEKGWVEAELERSGQKDVVVKWMPFTAAPLINEAMGAGAIDIILGEGAPPVLLARAAGMETKVVGVMCTAPQEEALVVRVDSPFQAVKDLRGHKVASIRGGGVYELLVLVLKDAGMSLSDVEFINLSPADMAVALGNKSVDAATLWEPLLTRTTMSGTGRILKTGLGLTSNLQLIVVSAKYAKENPLPIRATMKAIRRAADELRAHPDEWAERLASSMKLTPAENKNAMANHDWNPDLSSAVKAELKHDLDFLVENKFARGSFDIESFVDTSYGP